MRLRAILLLVPLSTPAYLSGCASAAKPDAMVPTGVPVAHRTDRDVMIAVSGGKVTSKAGMSEISDEDFAAALRQSLDQSTVFAKVAPSGAYYKLTAYIGKVEQPMFGFNMTVSMEVSYSLIDTQSGKSVWSKSVQSAFTATTGEAFSGVARLRLANEGAARDNIRQAVTALETAQF